jgi:hypothetical protein
MEKFRLYDSYTTYGGKDLIGKPNTEKEVAQQCTEYAEGCEDCCIFELYIRVEEDETGARYKRIKNWSYTKNTIKIEEV